MMKHLYLPVKALSPLAIRSDHAPEGSATTHAIPGATVLGSLAAAHRMLRPGADEQFRQLFLNENVSMPFLYPAKFAVSRFETSNSPVMPLPKTAQTCKRFSGFQPLSDEFDADGPRHGVRDSLFDWAIFSLLEAEKHPLSTMLDVLDAHKECSDEYCTHPMDHLTGGYYRCVGDDPRQKMMAQVGTHLQTRTGINRRWGVVEEGILYNREVFDETMRFWGEVILPDALSDTFLHFVKEANEEDVLRVGTGRTRGLGRVEIIELKRQSASRESLSHFDHRIREFSETLKIQAKKAGVKTLAAFYFAITLRSATILCDPFLRYCTTLDPTMLASELEETAGAFKLVYQATETQRISGWNELWGTPRPQDYALAMGSTFLFACTRELDDKLTHALYNLEEQGLGRRRTEGFGRISISDPFHLEGEQR